MINPSGESLSQQEGDNQQQEDTLFRRPRSGNSDDKAHPPIHPVKRFTGDRMSDEFRVYDLICRHFIACCSKAAVYEETEVELTIEEEKFYLKGTRGS